jgi:predicted alpha/beta-hydrolase family hydrolase
VDWIPEKPKTWDGKTALILAHGAGQGMQSPFMTYFHEEMARRGLLSVKFDFEYMQQKRKVPDPQPKLRQRYKQVIEEVALEFKPQRIVIGGKSMGGRVASYIASEIDAVAGLVFLGYPLHPPGKPDQLRDAHLYELMKPMLFISGTRDTLAEKDLLQGVVDRIGKRATLLWIERGDHSLKTGRKDTTSLATAAETIESWIAKL